MLFCGVKSTLAAEIVSTFTIEQQVDFTRDSVRKILSFLAPTDESESRIFGMKKGLEFISDPANQITEETIHQLYGSRSKRVRSVPIAFFSMRET